MKHTRSFQSRVTKIVLHATLNNPERNTIKIITVTDCSYMNASIALLKETIEP